MALAHPTWAEGALPHGRRLQTPCFEHAADLLRRVSPPESEPTWGVPVAFPRPINRPTVSVPARMILKNLNNRSMPVVVGDSATLAREVRAESKTGVWMIYSPTGPQSRIPTGHMMILVDGNLYSRNVDSGAESGPRVYVPPLDEIVGQNPREGYESLLTGIPSAHRGPFIIAQRLSFSEASVRALDEFYRRRIEWHGIQETWGTQYRELPLTHHSGIPGAENCVLFTMSWLQKKWQSLVPALEHPVLESGEMRISEIPARQIFNVAGFHNHEHSIIVSPTPEDTAQILRDAARYRDGPFGTLYLDQPAQFIESAPSTLPTQP